MDTHEFQTIKAEVEGPLGRLTLNRPDRLNAIGATMLQELAEAAHWFDTHRDLRVVIMSGAGRAFCAGADLKDPPAAGQLDREKSWLFRREAGQYGLRAADALEQLRAVTIAQVQGYAVGQFDSKSPCQPLCTYVAPGTTALGVVGMAFPPRLEAS